MTIPDIQSALSHLRDEFIACLPERIATLQALLDAVARGELASLEPLHRAAHSLVGTAGIHHLGQISEAARELEHLAAALPLNAKVGAADVLALQAALVKLAAHAAHPIPDLVPPPPEHAHSARIMVVEDDEGQAAWLCSVLEQEGYQVEVFGELAAFRTALQNGEPPAAVIMDMVFPEGDEAGAQVIAEMKAQNLKVVPVIFLSVRQDIAAKLAAYRAGATRYLTKPVDRAALLRVIADSAALVPTQPYRVLVVDDSKSQLIAHTHMLRHAGMEVREADNPLHVLDMLENFAAEVLLLDMYMPQCSGPELAAILGDDARYADIPIVYLSTEASISRQLLALDRGGDHFLVKPVNPAHLVAVTGMHARRFRQAVEQAESLRSIRYERERQQQALDAHAIVSATDAAGKIIYVNDKFCEAGGYSREELLGENHRIIKSDMHPPELYGGMWQRIKSGQIWHGELCNKRKDGGLYWVETSIVPFLGGNGQPYQYISVRTDISALKQQQEALRNNEAQLRMVLDNAADAVFVAGKDERWAYVNDKAVAMLGYSREELLAMSLYDIVPADWREVYRQNFREKLLADGVMHQEIRLLKKDGGKLVIEMNAAVLPNGQVYGSCRDIGARKEAEAAIRDATLRIHESEQRLKQAQQIAHLGSFDWNPVSGDLQWSNEHYRLWGLQPGSVTPDYGLFRRGIHPDDVAKVEDTLRQALHGTQLYECLHRVVWPNGEERYILGLGEVMFEGAGQAVRMIGTVQDVTERRLAEEALRQTQQLLDSIVENIPVMIFVKRADDLRFELFNRAGEEMLGYSRNDLLGKNDYDFFSGEQADFFTAQDRKVLASEEVVEIQQEPIRIANGETRYLHTWKTALRDKNGKPTHLLGISLDITERKRTEQALMESHARLEAAQVQAHLGNWEADLITGELYWSDEIFRIFGHDPARFTPSVEAFTSAIHPDDIEKVRESERRAVETGIHDVVHRIVRPDGEIRYVHEMANSQLDAGGQLVRLIGTAQDITEQKQAELARSEVLERLQKISNRVPGVVYQFRLRPDGSSCFPYASEASRELFRLDPEEISEDASGVFAICHPDDFAALIESIQLSAQNQTPWHHEMRTRFDDGVARWLSGNAVPQREADGSVLWHGFISDITERKKVDEALLAAKEAAESANRAKSEFLASMSHELRTPLNAILGFSQLFGMDSRLPQDARNNAREIEGAGQHLLSLINDMIDLARIEAGKLGLSLEPVQIQQVLKNSLSMLESLARDKGIRLIEAACAVCADQPILVMADLVRLRQVMINLITNAIKYNKPQGSVTISCEIGVGTTRISVTDTGSGIPPDKQGRIFNAFDRLGEERGDVEGTGIGLVITKRIVEAMGGSIGFESTVGMGSTFWVEFPLAAATVTQHAAAVTDAVVVPDAADATARFTVLYIEDNPMNLRLMQQIFASRKNLDLRHAETAEAGIAQAQTHTPALILMDINLPGMNGYAALKILKADARTAHIPVIAITADAMMGDIEHGAQAGFADYLTKPLDVVRFLAILDKIFKDQAG